MGVKEDWKSLNEAYRDQSVNCAVLGSTYFRLWLYVLLCASLECADVLKIASDSGLTCSGNYGVQIMVHSRE